MHSHGAKMDFGVDWLPAHGAVIDQLVAQQQIHDLEHTLISGCKLLEYSFFLD